MTSDKPDIHSIIRLCLSALLSDCLSQSVTSLFCMQASVRRLPTHLNTTHIILCKIYMHEVCIQQIKATHKLRKIGVDRMMST